MRGLRPDRSRFRPSREERINWQITCIINQVSQQPWNRLIKMLGVFCWLTITY